MRVGFEARGHGGEGSRAAPAAVLNALMEVTRVAGRIGIPGSMSPTIPAPPIAARQPVGVRLGWAKAHSFHTGQTPVTK